MSDSIIEAREIETLKEFKIKLEKFNFKIIKAFLHKVKLNAYKNINAIISLINTLVENESYKDSLNSKLKLPDHLYSHLTILINNIINIITRRGKDKVSTSEIEKYITENDVIALLNKRFNKQFTATKAEIQEEEEGEGDGEEEGEEHQQQILQAVRESINIVKNKLMDRVVNNPLNLHRRQKNPKNYLKKKS